MLADYGFRKTVFIVFQASQRKGGKGDTNLAPQRNQTAVPIAIASAVTVTREYYGRILAQVTVEGGFPCCRRVVLGNWWLWDPLVRETLTPTLSTRERE
ncbi:hypothetical protein Pan258_49110 [Symmachiella dynata]|nr:hypothetical protein Pan258_49110 [Symmachiella dynata]